MIDKQIIKVLKALGSVEFRTQSDGVRTNCPLQWNHIRKDQHPSMFIYSSHPRSGKQSMAFCHSCFPLHTPVLTRDGVKNISEVNIGDQVLTHKGEWKNVLNVWDRKYEGKMMRLRISHLVVPLECTPEHPIYGLKQHEISNKEMTKKPYFIEAKELEVGDWVVLPKLAGKDEVIQFKVQNEKYIYSKKGPRPKRLPEVFIVNRDIAWMLGFYIANGSGNHNRSAVFTFNTKKKEDSDKLTRIISENFYLDCVEKNCPSHGRRDVFVNNCIFARWIKEKCGDGARNKKIPDELFRGNQEILRSFLDGYCAGDGHDTYGGKCITTISKTLCQQVMVVVATLRYAPRMQVWKSFTDKNGVNHQESYTVLWSWDIQLIHNSIVFDDYYLCKVLDKREENVAVDVRDLTVEDHHSYNAFNVVVHNCQFKGSLSTLLWEVKKMKPELPRELMEYVDRCESGEDVIQLEIDLIPDYEATPNSVRTNPAIRNAVKNNQMIESSTIILRDQNLEIPVKEYGMVQSINYKDMEAMIVPYLDKIPSYWFERGYDNETARKWSVGLQDSVYYRKLKGSKQFYMDFGPRLLFGIKDYRQNWVGWSARAMQPEEKMQSFRHADRSPIYRAIGHPKYLHAPAFKRNSYLYGENAINCKVPVCFLCEGFFDVINISRHGFLNPLGMFGTALSDQQTEKIKQWFKTVIFIPDGDGPGIKSMEEAKKKLGGKVRFISIDPQSYMGRDPGDLTFDELNALISDCF